MKFNISQLAGFRESAHGVTRSVAVTGVTVALLGQLFVPGMVRADSISACMAEKIQQADDDMTVGGLRELCRSQAGSSGNVEETSTVAVVTKRLQQDKKNTLEPFTLMSHKPNYILLGAYNDSGYSPDAYRQQYNNPSIDLDNTEAQFQISLKTPLAIDLFDTFDVYAAYTNRSFWQLYNNDISSPFRETNHEPEIWAQFNSNREILGFTNTINSIGLVHQSNGQGGVLSRSWNRIYASIVLEKDNLALAFKPWYRIPEDDSDDDNPDITDYMGHYELRGAYKWGDNVFSAMSRNNLESGFEKGAVELGWSFPLGDYPYMKGYVQYFSGYGESLIDYDNYTNRIGIGFALTDWL